MESADKISGWLFLIARNTVIDHFRTTGKKAKLTEELPHDLEVQLEEDMPALENPEALRDAFRRLLFALPEPHREALVLTEYEGLTQKQLADRLGISLSGAKSRVQRAREKLKDALLECCALEFDRRGNVIECEARNSECNC